MLSTKTGCYCLLLFATIFAACSPKVRSPYAATNKIYKQHADSAAMVIQLEQPAMLVDSSGVQVPSEFVGTVNSNLRKPNYVIIHFTAQDSVRQTLGTFTVARTQVSAHYVVAKDGKVFHMLNDYLRAWHAGVSRWGSISDMNSCSIGIEIDNNGNEPFTGPQVKSVLALLTYLKKAYNIPATNFIGHQDIAPLRKPDPGPYFPWKILAQHGFGYWSDDVLDLAPDNFDYVTALRLIGYDTSNVNAAVVAFKRHFVQTDIKPQLTQLDLNVLYNVYQKY
jgi:N-acetylmuramoyl-L-alanine amidase